MLLTPKQSLRQQKRLERRQLTVRQQTQAAHQLAHRIQRWPNFLKAKHLAIYWPFDGEISLKPLMRLAQAKHKFFYLPAIKGHQLLFAHYQLHQTLKSNRLGIFEPLNKSNLKSPQQLDIIFIPLVAFDKYGNRLGMGGGFYDRMMDKLKGVRPDLIGVGHALQQVDALICDPWDKPLNLIFTDKTLVRGCRTIKS